MTSFDVRFWKIETRKGRRTTYRVRWVVSGRPFGESFLTMALAESFRAKLITAARNGEGFDTETGLPDSMMRKLRDVSFFDTPWSSRTRPRRRYPPSPAAPSSRRSPG